MRSRSPAVLLVLLLVGAMGVIAFFQGMGGWRFSTEPELAPVDLERAVEIRAFDERTGAELSEVSLAPSMSRAGAVLGQPDLYRARTVSSPPLQYSSPVEAGACEGVWIGAPGYAWTPVLLSTEPKGTRSVALVQAGTLEIEVRGAVPHDAIVRIYRGEPALDEWAQPWIQESVLGSQISVVTDSAETQQKSSAPALERDSEGFAAAQESDRPLPGLARTLRLEDVPTGECTICIFEADYQPGYGKPIGQARATVAQGSIVRASLEVRAAVLEAVEEAPLEGIVVIPDRLEASFGPLTLSSQSTNRSVSIDRETMTQRAGSGEWRWNAGRFPVGGVHAVLWGTGLEWHLDLPKSGATSVRWVVPEICELTVELVEARSGAALEHGSAWWHPVGAQSTGSLAGNSGFHKALVPRGLVCLHVEDGLGALRSESKQVELPEGAHTERFSLGPATGIDLRYRDRGTRVPVLRPPVAADVPDEEQRFDGERGRLLLPGHRKVKLRFPSVEGYKAIPDRVVDVPESGFVEVTADLERNASRPK